MRLEKREEEKKKTKPALSLRRGLQRPIASSFFFFLCSSSLISRAKLALLASEPNCVFLSFISRSTARSRRVQA